MLAQTEAALSDYPASGAWARTAKEIAEEDGDRALALRADIVILEALGQTDPQHALAASLTGAEPVRRELEALGDETGVVEALLMLSRAEFFAGRCDRAREIAEETVTRHEIARAPLRVRAAIQLGVASYFGSMPIEEALALHPRIEAIAPKGLLTDAVMSNGRFAFLAMAGREERAMAEAARNDALWEEIGNPGLEVNRYESRGEGMTYLGRFEEAERAFRRGVEIFDSLGETGFNSTMTAMHASALCRLDRFEEAQAEADRSRSLASDDDFASQVQWRGAQAWVCSARGEHEEAIRLIDEATAIAGPSDYLVLQADTAAIRGLVMRAAGRTEEARAAFEDALERYERKGAVLVARRMRDELATLPPATA